MNPNGSNGGPSPPRDVTNHFHFYLNLPANTRLGLSLVLTTVAAAVSNINHQHQQPMVDQPPTVEEVPPAERKCVICYDNQPSATLSCGHRFCALCCSKLDHHNMPCALCRARIVEWVPDAE